MQTTRTTFGTIAVWVMTALVAAGCGTLTGAVVGAAAGTVYDAMRRK